MAWDMIHDTQQVYRQLIDAYAHPGTIIDLNSFITKADETIVPMMFILASVVLDNEVSFHVLDDDHAERALQERFLARQSIISNADYVFVNGPDVMDWPAVFGALKTGSLINPHQSATVFIRVRSLANTRFVSLRGPGIKTSTPLSCGLDNTLFPALSKPYGEYPSGIDVLLYDDTGHMAAILRTTRITMEV